MSVASYLEKCNAGMACNGDQDNAGAEASHFSCDLVVPFTSSDDAEIAHRSLTVDREPKKDQVSKQLIVKEKNLYVTIRSKKAGVLRVAVNSFMDHLKLVIQTIDEFSLTT